MMDTMRLSYRDLMHLKENNLEVFKFYKQLSEKRRQEEENFRKALIYATFGKLPD